jgi:hypothetical protein
VLTLERLGTVWIEEKKSVPILLRKEVTFLPDRSDFEVAYTLINKSSQSISLWFGIELGFAFTSGNDPQQHYILGSLSNNDCLLNSRGETQNIDKVTLVDERQKFHVSVSLSQSAEFWRFPLETISMSEGGFEKVFQGAVVLAHWKLKLDSKSSWKVHLHSIIEG